MKMQAQKLYYTKYFCPQTLQILVAADFAGVKLQLNQINKKYDPVSLSTKKGVLNRTNSIMRYICSGTNLNGANQAQRNQINTWFDYFNSQMYPLLTQLYAEVFGQKPSVQVKYTYCLAQMNKNLKVLDDCLKVKTFFIGDSITIFDITLVCYLQSLFKLIVNEADRKKITNLIRWYNYIRQIPILTKYFGKIIMCGKQSFKIQFNCPESSTQKAESSKQTPKVQQKKLTKKERKVEATEQEKGQRKDIQNKKQNDPSTFKLDDFKRQFQNSQNKSEVLKKLLDNFDSQKFSIWKIHYLKDVTEGKVLFLTQNLANGSLQRIDGIRKSAFGTWGVYGQQGDYQIRGVMIWEGTDIDNCWKQHPAFQYHKFTKLSPETEEDRKTILDYLLERQCAQGLITRQTRVIV